MVRVRRLDGEDTGLQEWVPRTALLDRWDVIEERPRDERRLRAVIEASAEVADGAEWEAARFVLEHAGLGRLVVLGRNRAERGVVRVAKPDRLAAQLATDLASLAVADPLAFTDRSGVLVMPWSAGLVVLQGIARAFAEQLVSEMHDDEERLRDQVTRGWHRTYSWEEREARPEEALKAREPLYALVRTWCGAEAVDRFDELVALRAEVIRLGKLVERSVQALRKQGAATTAATIEHDLGIPIATLTNGLRL